MIELRIVETEVVEHVKVDHTRLVKKHRLQVRYREGPKGEDWWGKWQDVPIIPEDQIDVRDR